MDTAAKRLDVRRREIWMPDEDYKSSCIYLHEIAPDRRNLRQKS
jgi:hypothetical protein